MDVRWQRWQKTAIGDDSPPANLESEEWELRARESRGDSTYDERSYVQVLRSSVAWATVYERKSVYLCASVGDGH